MDNIKTFLNLQRNKQRSSLEALIFASEEAISSKMLFKILTNYESTPTETLKITEFDQKQANQQELFTLFNELVEEINEDLKITGRAFRIVEVANGFQFATTSEFGELVVLLAKNKSKRKLSQAALESLAIIAYRQPISKPEIEAIRGVNCNEVVNSLMEKNLVTIVGRSENVGRPLLYGTTEDFLRAFGLQNLSNLPKPRELEEMLEKFQTTAEIR